MTTTMKIAYYVDARMVPSLARRYHRLLAPAVRILDVGCGTGDFGRYRLAGAEVWGVDTDVMALERAERYEIPLVVDLECDDLPFEDGFFDAVLAKDVLEHLQDPGRVARELLRVLRPGGKLIASLVVASPRRVWADYTHVRGFTERSARMLFEDAGFHVDSIWAMGGVPLSARLGFIEVVPSILRVPGLRGLWHSSWELLALAPSEDRP
jgi:SAM-dependent methyltransferase